MKSVDLHAAAVSELVDRFAIVCIDQNKALLEGEIAKFNCLFDQMVAVENELKLRSGDQRRALLTLFEHTDLQVRLQAAKATLAVVPQAARNMLERIKEWRLQPQAGDAGITLMNLDRGVFVPK